MGGDCLNTGCVPSKALLAAGKCAQMHRKDDIKGIKAHEPEIDFSAVKDHVFDTIKTIEPNDSIERFEGFGVKVIQESGHFIDEDTIKAGNYTIKARYFVIATGSRANIPTIIGLDKDKAFTNETIFGVRKKPEHLLIIGGGPIGMEMAQAHRRLGCDVSIFNRGVILPRDDKKNVEVLKDALLNEGIKIHENISIKKIKHTSSGVNIIIDDSEGETQEFKGSHILIAAGRAPNIEGLDLEKASVNYNPKGIIVDPQLRSSNKKIFAIGDVSGGPQFTHVAGYHAGIIIRQICFRILWAKVDYKALPWVTYTDPELAQVGLTEDTARAQYGDDIKVAQWSFDENDRAIAEKETKGQIRIITNKKGRILGASIVGSKAGELIGLWALAISSKQKIGAITSMIAPYPTLGEISKRAAGAWYTPSLFSNKTRRIVKWLQKLPI